MVTNNSSNNITFIMKWNFFIDMVDKSDSNWAALHKTFNDYYHKLIYYVLLTVVTSNHFLLLAPTTTLKSFTSIVCS